MNFASGREHGFRFTEVEADRGTDFYPSVSGVDSQTEKMCKTQFFLLPILIGFVALLSDGLHHLLPEEEEPQTRLQRPRPALAHSGPGSRGRVRRGVRRRVKG